LNQGFQHLTEQSALLSGYDCSSLARAAEWPAQLARQNELQTALKGMPPR
jgi:hypothetical protein